MKKSEATFSDPSLILMLYDAAENNAAELELYYQDSVPRRMPSKDKRDRPTRMSTGLEWDLYHSLRYFLKSFMNAQKMLESDSKLTSYLFFLWERLLLPGWTPLVPQASRQWLKEMILTSKDFPSLWLDLQKSCRRTLNRVGVTFKNHSAHKEESRPARQRQKGIHPKFIMAFALDPRFKDRGLIEDKANRQEVFVTVIKEMIKAKTQLQGLKSSDMEKGDPCEDSESEGESEQPAKNIFAMHYAIISKNPRQQ
jgi:hypothetical protein